LTLNQHNFDLPCLCQWKWKYHTRFLFDFDYILLINDEREENIYFWFIIKTQYLQTENLYRLHRLSMTYAICIQRCSVLFSV